MTKDSGNESDTQVSPNIDIETFTSAPDEIVAVSDGNIVDLYESAIHDYTQVYDKPDTILEVNEKICGTLGNFSIISGKAKSKKTYLLSAVVPSLLTGNIILGHLRSALPFSKKRILYFDTEQAPYHVQQVIERGLKIGDIDKHKAKDYLKVFDLRPCSIEHRFEIIEHGIETEKGVGVVIIDGLRDLMHDINNMTEATAIVSSLLKWTTEKDIHIIAVLHQNKTDNNVRGNIGTEVMNKCEALVEVSQHKANKHVSIVEFPFTRNQPPDPFAFSVGEDGLPYAVDIPNYVKPGRKKTDPSEVESEEHRKSLEAFFNGQESINQSQLIRLYQGHFSIGNNKARGYIDYCADDLKLIKRSSGKGNSIIYQMI